MPGTSCRQHTRQNFIKLDRSLRQPVVDRDQLDRSLLDSSTATRAPRRMQSASTGSTVTRQELDRRPEDSRRSSTPRQARRAFSKRLGFSFELAARARAGLQAAPAASDQIVILFFRTIPYRLSRNYTGASPATGNAACVGAKEASRSVEARTKCHTNLIVSRWSWKSTYTSERRTYPEQSTIIARTRPPRPPTSRFAPEAEPGL